MPSQFEYLAEVIKSLEQGLEFSESNADTVIEGTSSADIDEYGEEVQWEMLDLKTIKEVQDCAEMLVNLNDNLNKEDPEALRMAINLFTEITNLICCKPELAEGLQAWHVRSYSDILFDAEEYGEAYDLLLFVQDYPELQIGITSAQVAELAQVIFDDIKIDENDQDDEKDGDVLDAQERSLEINEDFLAVMNSVSDKPIWRTDIPPELWMEEYEILRWQFDHLVEQKLWFTFVDDMDYRRHRPLILDVLAAHHLPLVIEGLLINNSQDSIIRMTNLLDMAAGDLPDLSQYISPEHRSQMVGAIIQNAKENIKMESYENYGQTLFGAENLPEIYRQLAAPEFIFALAVNLNIKFHEKSDTEKEKIFLSNIMDYHETVFEKLSALAKGFSPATGQRLLSSGSRSTAQSQGPVIT